MGTLENDGYGYRLTEDKIGDAHRIDRLIMTLVCSLGYRAFEQSVFDRWERAILAGDDEQWHWWGAVKDRLRELERGMAR